MVEFRRVPSYPAFVVTDQGDVIGPSGRKLAHFPDKNGYRRVNLYLGDRKWKQLGVHTLVCEAFHGERPPSGMVGHGDGDPANNAAINLRWTTQWQNEHDKRRHGTALLGERHHQAKLTEEDVRAIRRRRAAGESGLSLAREFRVTPSAICAVHKRKTWAHFS